MTELIQNLIDGLGRGSIYALLALGVAVIFGVMHLLNFAHGELITVSGYVAYAALLQGWSWYLVAPLIIVTAV
ncbi:MAG: branched-chain amino acid ABC transporter permease, partial [Actinomycetota bacterium]